MANKLRSGSRCREVTPDAPAIFNLMANERVSLAGCNDTSIYLQCIKVQVNMDAILDDAVTEVSLPDGTIVTRSEICDDGHVDENGNGCAHFNNDDHTASIYMSYSLQESATRGSEIVTKAIALATYVLFQDNWRLALT